MKLLRDQELSITHINVIFQALFIYRLPYAVQAWGGFLFVRYLSGNRFYFDV